MKIFMWKDLKKFRGRMINLSKHMNIVILVIVGLDELSYFHSSLII